MPNSLFCCFRSSIKRLINFVPFITLPEKMSIRDNIETINNRISSREITLVAVSKTKPVSYIEEAYSAGHRHFGENKVQELVDKHEQLPEDVRWHMIGHLQRNKVKYIISFVHLIHGVDSTRLLEQIEKEARKIDKKVACLLQIHIAQENSKFGFSEEELLDLLNSNAVRDLKHVQIDGLMGMATNTADNSIIQQEFKTLKTLFDKLKYSPLPEHVSMQTLSMGMSGDYELALNCGSNMIRVGSAIFGKRNHL